MLFIFFLLFICVILNEVKNPKSVVYVHRSFALLRMTRRAEYTTLKFKAANLQEKSVATKENVCIFARKFKK